MRANKICVDHFTLRVFFLTFSFLTQKFGRLTGLAIDPRAHVKLKHLYEKMLRLTNKLPLNYPYKKYVESIICQRMHIVNEHGENHEKIEELCNAKVENMILQGENEFLLVRKILEVKAWEPLRERPPPDQWTWPPVIK